MKLAEALQLIHQAPAGASPYQVLLACGFSPLHLHTFLAAHLQARLPDRKVQIQTGLYGSLADTLEALPGFRGEATALFLEWPDLDSRLGYRSSGGWETATVEDPLARLASALRHKLPALRVVVSLPTLPLPPGFHTVGWQASAAELSLESDLANFTREISLLPSVLVVHRQQLDRSSPLAERYDFRSDLNTGFPYSLRHTDWIAQAVAGLLTLPPPKKGLISDLDDTMWRGIVGEEGPDGVAWDLAGHAQIHGLYQQMLQSLVNQGVLLGIASKNNAGIAEKALQRPDFLIKQEKIFPAEIHWEAKSGSVARILKTWNIGADSVVFIDDSPMELEEVRAAHPGLECILFPKSDPAAALALLWKLRDLFGKPTLSQEDTFRLESIRNSREFLEGADDHDRAEQFLASAEATVTFEWQPDASDTRVLELVNKTNQFNLNGRRWSEAEWRQAVSLPDAFIVAVSYADKFGPLGKISVVQGQRNGDTVHVETWVMSCRAFSRRIEYQVLQQIFEKLAVQRIQFSYAETPKNAPAGDFLTGLLGDEKSLTRAAFEEKCKTLYHQIKQHYPENHGQHGTSVNQGLSGRLS